MEITSKKNLKILNYSFFSVEKVLDVYLLLLTLFLPKISYYGYICLVYKIFNHATFPIYLVYRR